MYGLKLTKHDNKITKVIQGVAFVIGVIVILCILYWLLTYNLNF